MLKKEDNCLVCGVVEAKYKFKCCLRPFCSAKCFRDHSECVAPVAPKPFIPERRIIRSDNNDLNLSEDEILQDDTLDLLKNNPEVIELLKDPMLRRMLVRLDISRDRRRVFEKMSETSPLFVQFLEKVSSVLDITPP